MLITFSASLMKCNYALFSLTHTYHTVLSQLFYYNCFVNDKNYCIYKTSRLIHFKGENSRTVWISNIEQVEKELKNGFNNGYFYDGEKKAYFKVANKIGTFLNSSCCLITNVFLDDKDLQIEFDKVWENKNNFNITFKYRFVFISFSVSKQV